MSTTPLAKLALAGAAFAALAACTDPLPTDYREKYALRPYPTTVVMPVHVVQDSLADDEEARLAPLVASYLERGHGPITISARSPDLRAGVPENLRRMRERLLAAGVPASAIRVLITEQGGSDAVTVSYERYEVAVPICGDWSGSAVYDPYNDVHSNFGCATQRNVGLMVADPADLVRKRDSSSDAQSSDRIVQRYRAGQPPGAIPNPQQLLGASGQSR
jgi:pilus assembly protein CpaD